MPDNILKYIFRDKSGAKHTVWKSDYDADPRGFAKAYPDARFEVVNRKTGDRGHVSVNDVGAAKKEGFNLFTMKAYQKEHYEKPKTIKQRAQEVAAQYQKGKQTKQPVDYLHRPQSQMGRPHRNVPAKASPFVRSLYEIDNAQKGPDYSVDYTSPKATQQVYQKNQHVRRKAAQTASDHIANDEYRRQSQPMIDNGTVGVMKPMGEIEQEMSDSASKFVDANLGDYINKAVLGEQNASAQRGLDASNRVPLQAGAGGMGLMVKGMAYNEQVDPDLMAKNLTDNARDGFLKLFQDPNFVAKVENEATRLGVTPEAYMESIIPHLKDRLATSLHESEYQKALPKNMLDNIANRFIDSNTIGKALRLATQTRGQRILNEQASAATAEGKNPYYKGGTVENVTADVAGMVADPIFGASAKLGGAVAGKLIGNSTKLSALMANGNLAQRLMAKGAQAVTSGGVTGFVFDSTGSVIQNYSTGEDTSLGNTLKVAAKGGTTGAVNFATMSLAGIPLSEVGRSIGLKAVKGGSFWGNTGRATAKIGLESGKTYMEAMGMYLGGYVSGKLEGRTDANGKPIEFDLWNGTMDSLPTAIGFRLQHAVEGLRGGRKNEKGEDMGWFGSTIANFKDFLTSDKAKESRFLMTDDERNQIFSSGAMNGLMPDGENIVSYAKRTKNKKVSYEDPYLETDASMIKNTYDQIMADPKVSWDAKAKFSAMVTGIMPSARPMMDYITYSSEDYVKDGLLRGKRKYVNEYSAKGELLSKIPYDSKVDRDNVVYKHNIVRENQRLYNAMGLLARQDRNNYELQNDFFVENMKKPGADVNILVTNMGDEGSHVFRDFSLFALNSEKGTVLKTIYSVAVRNGMKSEDLIKAMKKNPMKRSDFEQNVCVELRRALEAKAFPDGKVHVEQSNLNGKDVAEDNNLGTEQPNGDAVKQELNGLRQAEEEVEVLMRDNDVFSQNFKKLQSQGLTNPQIYDWMVQQGGLTVEQLEPFAHYINANARVQGMQEATKQKIEETVSVFAQDWSYHGTLNGQPMNGEQALYVHDSNGRTLLVGSGDVAFDQTTGRAKEGSGDMLVCFDPNTREMVYVKADEVTLLQNQPIDQFAAEYRQRLQMKNSEPYNQAAQEQAMLDAANPQPNKQEAPQDNTTKSEDSTTKEGDLTKDDTTLTKVDTTSGEDNTTNENLAPQEQPQHSRKFADGSDVPMATDSKGRPTPDYASMTPEQSAEILTEDFGDNAEKVVDGQIQKAEKALKDAEKMKVDYTAEPNDIMEQEALKNKTIEAAKKQLDHAQNIKKAMTAKKVAETVERPVEPERAADGVAQEAGVVSPKVKERFEASKKIKGRRGSITLADGTKIRGTYYYGETSGLTTSHDPFNDFKQSEGFPVNEDGTSSNSRSYRDKESRLFTQKIGNDFNGLALKNVPVVQEGITLSGNGTVMGKKLAEQAGKDSKYYEDLEDNAEGFGWTPEQIKGAGFKGIVYFVPDEKLPLNSKTFDLFNKKETKSESNTEQAVKNAKTLTSNEVGAIVAEIEGNGSLEAFFNNSKAINDLVKTLVDKGIIGQNEVAQMMDSPERLSAQGREYVKNLLLGSIFKPETIRMLGIDSTVKNKAINAIRSVMDNMKLGEFSLRDEIDQAIQLLYEARQGGNKVDTLLRTPSMFGEDAAKRYPSISQMMALALEGKVADFRDLLDEYNRIAAARNTGEGNVFGEAPTKPELIKEFLDFKKWQDYGTGHSENEGGNDVSGVEEPQQEASGGNEPAEAGEGRVKSEDEDKTNSVGFTPKEIRDHKEKLDRAKDKYVKALSEAKSEKEIKAAEDEFEFTYKDHQNMTGVLDEESVADMWKKELKSAKDSVKKDSNKLSADPMEALENAANAFHEEQKKKTEFKRNLEIGKARQEYDEAKKKGNADEISHAAGKLRNLLNEKYKAQGMGFVHRYEKIAEEIGKAEAEIIDKPWEQMDLEEREAVSSKNPLTESEINELTSEENKELIPAALAYLRGDKGNIINAISYFKIWNDVRNRHENVSDNSGTENGTQLDAADTTGGEGLGLGRGRESGRPDGPVDRGAGNEAAPGERNGREGDQNDTTLSAGEQGNKQGEGNSSGMGAVPAGSSDTNGGGSASGNGHVSGGSGRESSKRPADTNAGRKPTAKQGTTFPDSTAERLKQERADYEKKKKDFWARWKKAGQGYAKIALTPFKKLNLTPEQIEMLPELFKMHLNGAVLKIKEGIYKFNEWKAAMLAEEGEELKMIGLSDDDIDRFIEDYWNTPYEMDGETHTIREWSSIYGNQQLKKKLKEPLEEKYKRQMEAEPIEVKVGDMKNIEETLPYLLPQQQEDVLKAETQFFGKEHTDREHAYGKGYLFTNGTGTGKTYTGLGIAKRLAKQGKGRILFITPSQKKVSDWIKDGKNLGLDIKDLDSWAKERGTTATTESGEGMVITTFANFGLNKKLLETEWDAVIYDECHRIMENKKGTETARSMQHYMVTNRDENHCFQRLQSINPEYQKMNGAAEKFDALRLKEIDRIKKEYKNSHPSATNRDVDNATLKSLPRDLNSFAPADGMTFPKLGKAYQDFIKARDAYNKVEPKLKEQAKDSWKNTKTIFLSATPFNTRENLDYVEGYIFKYPETDERGMGGRTQFYLNHFGAAYKFRYHRLEQSISNPDAVAKQEVAFSDYLQNTLGTMSGRIIDSPYDYSRDFPTVAPDHAEDFNNAVQDTLKTKYLHDAYSKTIGDYNYGSALFETMKVSAAIDRIKQHLGLGRKVVIFHRRVESKEPLEAPFAYMLRVANEQIKMMKPGKERDEYIKECTEFRNKYADLLEWEKTLDYSMPREQIAKVFGEKNVLFFSGKESKKVKDKAIDTFNDDDSGKNIIVIQEASGKEGISLHDTTSKHQRVCITLALPQSPITALQIEGRIYRIGNMSNAIFEYPILGLNSEMMLFGEKFNNQVSTTENLALGSQARNLRDSFAKGILEHSGIVPVENQGVGGKEFDAATPSENDPFDNAVLDYYSNQKLNKNNREGSDYFPTPEPLGYKMVEWAGLGEGDSVLEPSAGHGAIARYVPKTNEMVSIEPSQSLFTKLQLRAGGLGRKFMNNTFENYSLNNKHDVIVMNPPFGKAGALAIQHVDKAFKHLDEGGRIVAIIPRGSTDKKFDKWYNEQKNVAMRAEVNLPDILFQQAGTRVACRVVVLDKISDSALRSKAGYPEKIDLSGHYDKIEDFFNDLRDIEMPERIIDTNLKMQKKAKAAVKDIMEIKGVKNVSYGKTGIDVSLTGSWMNYGISFTGSDKPNYWRDKMANYYNKYDELQKLEYQENKQSVFDELKKLSCKLAGMTEDEMQRYIASKSNGGTHFREDRGLQYSKTDTKDVKNSRIIPEDVDKNVSSQIEKKFDDEINRLFTHVTPSIRRWANAAIDLYSKDQTLNSWEVDENKNVTLSEGLNTVIDDLTKKINEYETKYGIRKDANIGELVNSILRKINSEGSGSGRNTSDKGQQEGTGGEAKTLPGGGGERRALDVLNDYKELSIRKAAAERAKAYIIARSKSLQETYGLKRDEPVSYETIDRIFNDYNSDPEVKELYDSIVNSLRSLGTEFYVGSIELARTKGYYKHSENFIKLNVDRLSAAGYTKQDLASTLCHEMLHPLTSDIIAMYQKGHTDKLSPSQIEAAKDAVDIYNELIKMQKEGKLEDYYGLENPREMITELASPEWRSALRKIPAAKKWYQKLINAICRMIGKDPKYNKLGEMERTLTNLLDNFGKEQFDFASQNENELFKDEYQGYKVTDKDELDRLNKEKTFRMYSGMQEVDGKLYSPMAAIIDGKRTDATEIGAWMGADERPDLVKNGKFQLVKTDKNPRAGEGPVPAAYNPYMHTSTSMMNDQFTGAYARGNIKVVEWEIPESEKTSGYHAEGAKDSVGLVPWHSGSVNSLLPKDRQRQVMLSRWRKAVRVVPDSEVAESIAEQLKGTGLAIPWNVVTPNQVRELAKLGVPITTVESGRQAPETKEKFLKQMVELEQEFPQAKFVNVKMTKDSYKEWGKDGGTKFRTNHGDGNYPASSVESHVENVAQKTGAKVNIVSSVDEINNKASKAAIEEGRKITGWYDEKTGEVHLYMPNIHDRYTAEKTIWHEVVGHKGMRELFGEDRFNQFLRDVWYDLDKPENAALKKLVDEERKYNPLNIYDAIEEGIARLAEDGKGEPGFWNGIKNKVSDFLHEIGYRIAPNTKDVKYLLWLSKNLQKNPNDPYWKLRAEAVKYRLDHDSVSAVVEKNGMFYGNDGKVSSMENMTKSEWNEATDGQIHFRTTPSAGTALDRYHRSLDEHGYMFTESYMDNMLSLKKLMNAIVPDKKIEDIASSENPYMLQNTMQGAMSDAAQMFERNVMNPLDKAMAGVLDAFDGKKDDEKIRNFNLYMITKHGLERNRVFFVRDFLRQMRMDEQKKQDANILENRWGNEKERLDNQLNAGNIDLKEYYRHMDEFISNEIYTDYKAGEHDYSGIHAIQEVAKSSDPYDDAEAIQSVMDSEAKMESIKKGAVKDYWDKVNSATQYSIDSDYKNNIIDKELHDYVSNMFNWYVPLRKYDEATAEDVYGYITEVGDPKNYIGSTIMRARGHKYLSETNVLAQIGAMGNRAIKNGGLNAIKMAFARFARNNSNNNLITEVSVWYEKDPMTGIVYERYPDIPEDATPDEINQIVADFNTDMNAKAAQGLASKVYRRGSIGYKFQRAENKSQHIVDVKIAGRTHSFIINGNPRAAQALNGLLEHKNDALAGRVAASISRNMAQLCTSYNPEFVMRNMIKDFEFASTNLLAKEGFRYTKLFEQYYAKVGIIEGIRNSKLKDLADTGGFGLFAKYRNGTLDTNDKVQRYFKEFMENGGETGWVQIKNMKDWTKEYKLHVKGERNKVQKVGKGFYNAIFKNLENINEIAENLARFSTYCASRDYGRSVIRSVYDAKEVSTNFNRHGSGNAIYSFKNGEMGTGKNARKNIYGFWAAWFRNSSMFFNAGIQSTNLLIKNFKNNKAGTIGYIASAPFISGMAMALLNNFIISNENEKDRKGVKDPYGELPDYIRRNNLCVYIGGGEFVTIPLAIEERAFYGLGDLAAGMTFSKNISSQKMPNLTENKDIDKYLNPFMDAVGCMSQLVPVADYLGNASFGKHPWQETIKALAPSATSPFLEWVYNSDWKGAPIQRDNKFDENQPSWMLAYKGTPEWMINMNKKVNALTNDVAPGNEDMKGNDFLDAVTNPSAMHHFYGSYFGGAATFVERVGGLIKNGKDTETKDIPFLRSLLYTPSEQSSLQRTKSKWYNYKDEMEKTMANVDRLKSKNVPIDKRITNIGEYYHFQNSKEAAKVRVIELAEKQMDRWKKMRDKASDTESINFANQNIDRIMMDAVDELDRLE